MHDQTGFRWYLTDRDGEWIWSLVSRDDDTPIIRGSAPTRALAAACVVRALICGVMDERDVEPLAA